MIDRIIQNQKNYFFEGNTKDLKNRIAQLKQLKKSIIEHTNELNEAFKQDLNKSEFDVLSTEIIPILEEINYLSKNIRKYFRAKKYGTNLFNFPCQRKTLREPFGVCLIISPWNYPFHLALLPLAGAIACGNTVVLKPSEYTPNINKVIIKILSIFNQNIVSIIEGDGEVASDLLNKNFDYIFFTGSEKIGKIVMKKASDKLIPITLELGGKSPTIITKTANVEIAAKRVAWGKFLNAGQTCIAPDYVLIDKDIKKEFVEYLIKYIKKFYYSNDKLNNQFTHIITHKHMERLVGLIDFDKVIFGGKYDGLFIEPTLIDNIKFDDKIMQEEIFGPILPIVEYTDLNDEIVKLQKLNKPLALYLFSEDKKEQELVFSSLSFGGGCINDVIMHVMDNNLPFGGVGTSGMGSYHGLKSIETFSRIKSVMIKGKKEMNLKYPPYNDSKIKLVKKLFKIK